MIKSKPPKNIKQYVLKEKVVDKYDFIDILHSFKTEFEFIRNKDENTYKEKNLHSAHNETYGLRNPFNTYLMKADSQLTNKYEIKKKRNLELKTNTLKAELPNINFEKSSFRSDYNKLESKHLPMVKKFKTDILWNPSNIINSAINENFNLHGINLKNESFLIPHCFKLFNNFLDHKFSRQGHLKIETNSLDWKEIKYNTKGESKIKYYEKYLNNIKNLLIDFKKNLCPNINETCRYFNISLDNINLNPKLDWVSLNKKDQMQKAIYSDLNFINNKLDMFVKRMKKYKYTDETKQGINDISRKNKIIMNKFGLDRSIQDQIRIKSIFSVKSEKFSSVSLFGSHQSIIDKINNHPHNLSRKRGRPANPKENKLNTLKKTLKSSFKNAQDKNFNYTEIFSSNSNSTSNNLKIRIDMSIFKEQKSFINETLEHIQNLSSNPILVEENMTKSDSRKLLTTVSDESHHNGLDRVNLLSREKQSINNIVPSFKKKKKIFEIKKDLKNKKIKQSYNGNMPYEDYEMHIEMKKESENATFYSLKYDQIDKQSCKSITTQIHSKTFYASELKFYKNVSFKLKGSTNSDSISK